MPATAQEIEQAISSPNYSHSRRGYGCWRDVVWVYHRDHASPSGFKLAVGGDFSIVDPLLQKAKEPSALSPTEPR